MGRGFKFWETVIILFSSIPQALISASQGPEAHDSMGSNYDEDAAVFFFEQFITCILQNRYSCVIV